MNPSFTDAKLRQCCSKKNCCSYSGSITLTERRCQCLLDKHQSLKARIHKPKSIYVEFNVR